MIFQRFYNVKPVKKDERKDTFQRSNEIINHVQQVTENQPLDTVGLEFALDNRLLRP